MAILQQLKQRRIVISRLDKITRAMEIVSLTRKKKKERILLDLKPYPTYLRQLIANLSLYLSAETIFYKRHDNKEGTKRMIFIITSEKGLSSGFDANLATYLRERRSKGYRIRKIIIIGRRISSLYRIYPEVEIEIVQRPKILFSNLEEVERRLYDVLHSLVGRIIYAYQGGELTDVSILYNQYRLSLLGKVTEENLLPLPSIERGGGYRREYLYEPDVSDFLEELVREYLYSILNLAIWESSTAEEMARMVAMKQANDNAKELLREINLQFNRQRQTVITRELIDILPVDMKG